MKIISVKSLAIPAVKVIRYQRFQDERGYFSEILQKKDLQKIIPGFEVVQINESSSKKGVMRGLHLQWDPYMGKLVRTVQGHMVDLVADLRKNSSTYGKILAYDMPASPDEDFNEWIWIPVGFAHGNFYLDDSSIQYCCTGNYNPSCEAVISPIAPDLDWSLSNLDLKKLFADLVKNGSNMSEKDRNGLSVEKWTSDPRSENFKL